MNPLSTLTLNNLGDVSKVEAYILSLCDQAVSLAHQAIAVAGEAAAYGVDPSAAIAAANSAIAVINSYRAQSVALFNKLSADLGSLESTYPLNTSLSDIFSKVYGSDAGSVDLSQYLGGATIQVPSFPSLTSSSGPSVAQITADLAPSATIGSGSSTMSLATTPSFQISNSNFTLTSNDITYQSQPVNQSALQTVVNTAELLSTPLGKVLDVLEALKDKDVLKYLSSHANDLGLSQAQANTLVDSLSSVWSKAAIGVGSAAAKALDFINPLYDVYKDSTLYLGQHANSNGPITGQMIVDDVKAVSDLGLVTAEKALLTAGASAALTPAVGAVVGVALGLIPDSVFQSINTTVGNLLPAATSAEHSAADLIGNNVHIGLIGAPSSVQPPLVSGGTTVNVAVFSNTASATSTDPVKEVGGSSNDILLGNGNSLFYGGPGDDVILGGTGTNTSVYSGPRANYQIFESDGTTSGTTQLQNTQGSSSGTSTQQSSLTASPNTNWLVVTGNQGNSPDGTDTLYNVERLVFTDQKLALDLGTGQAAGNTVRVIGAGLGANNIQAHPEWVGTGLGLFDSGMNMQQVCALVIGAMGSPNNVDFVNTVYQNVVGSAPSDAARSYYVGLLQGSGGTMSQADLLALAANNDANVQHINLVGLQQTGVQFA